jgi:hypothetical protein
MLILINNKDMSVLEVLENLVFWTLIIFIAFMAKDTPKIAFTILFYLLIYFILKRLITGGSSDVIVLFSINLVLLVFLTIYFSTGITPMDMIQGLIKYIMMIPKLFT